VARLLVENNETEEQAAARVGAIYDRVQNRVYLFLTATLLAITVTSLYVIGVNRRIFAQLEELSGQRSELAQKLIATQESTLLHISRELHDEFGQVLTAIGSMLKRAGKHAPEGSTLRADLQEVSEIAQASLNNVRGLSQALHPVMLEEAGLEKTIEWYLPVLQRQTGIAISYAKTGAGFAVERGAGVHIYRVLQEALNNVVRHSGAREAWVRLRFLPAMLQLEVEDHGKGFAPQAGQHGIGLVAMRERAGLLGGTLAINNIEGGGTLVRVDVPQTKYERNV
jgi:signal transduction histidine kinase